MGGGSLIFLFIQRYSIEKQDKYVYIRIIKRFSDVDHSEK